MTEPHRAKTEKSKSQFHLPTEFGLGTAEFSTPQLPYSITPRSLCLRFRNLRPILVEDIDGDIRERMLVELFQHVETERADV